MGSARPALFALVLVLLLFWSVLPPTVGQGSTGHLVVWKDLELLGTSAQYVEMYPFDLRDKVSDAATSFNRSTDGLTGTDANTTGPVEIRFLFEANITTKEGRVPLATRALVDALYDGFSYLAVQSP